MTAVVSAVDPADAATAERVTRLVEAAAPDLLRYLARRVEQPADAADLLSDTLVVLWRRRHDLPQDDERARMWMFGVARRTLAGARRGIRRRSALVERLRSELAEQHTSPGADDEDERLQALRDAVAGLPSTDREIIRLVHGDGLSLAQVAEHLGAPAGTVRSRYARARARLRVALG